MPASCNHHSCMLDSDDDDEDVEEADNDDDEEDVEKADDVNDGIHPK